MNHRPAGAGRLVPFRGPRPPGSAASLWHAGCGRRLQEEDVVEAVRDQWVIALAVVVAVALLLWLVLATR